MYFRTCGELLGKMMQGDFTNPSSWIWKKNNDSIGEDTPSWENKMQSFYQSNWLFKPTLYYWKTGSRSHQVKKYSTILVWPVPWQWFMAYCSSRHQVFSPGHYHILGYSLLRLAFMPPLVESITTPENAQCFMTPFFMVYPRIHLHDKASWRIVPLP
jgi:hypothetical protein